MPAKPQDPEVAIRKAVGAYEKLLRTMIARRSELSGREPTQQMVREITREIFPKLRAGHLAGRRRSYLEVGLPTAVYKEFSRMCRENEWQPEEVLDVMVRRALKENVNLVFEIIKNRQRRKRREEI